MDFSKITLVELQTKLKDRSPAQVSELFKSVGFETDPKASVIDQCAAAYKTATQPEQNKSAPLAGSLPAAPSTPASGVDPSLPVVRIPEFFVRAKAPKRRRAGRNWTPALTRVRVTEFTKEQWAELHADKLIEIREIV